MCGVQRCYEKGEAEFECEQILHELILFRRSISIACQFRRFIICKDRNYAKGCSFLNEGKEET